MHHWTEIKCLIGPPFTQTRTQIHVRCSSTTSLMSDHVREQSRTASVHRHRELARSTAAFLPIFCSQLGLDLCCWATRSGEMNTGVSFQQADCLACSVSRDIALLEDKELTTDLMHNRL